MEVTELGMVTDVRPLQPSKALKPMDVTELGMVTDVRPLQPEKACPGMFVTLLPIFSVAKAVHPLNTLELPGCVQLVALKFTVVRPVQF